MFPKILPQSPPISLKILRSLGSTVFSDIDWKPLWAYGEGEIRTPGAFQLIRFQVGRNRPLCHLSNHFDLSLLVSQISTDTILHDLTGVSIVKQEETKEYAMKEDSAGSISLANY